MQALGWMEGAREVGLALEALHQPDRLRALAQVVRL